MIIVKLIGGLGNQLFQYALGRHLAERTGGALRLDISGFQTYTLHRYSLGAFNISEKFALPVDVASFRGTSRNFITRLFRRESQGDASWVTECDPTFDSTVLQRTDPLYLDGYWQSEKYFLDIEDIIRQEFTVKTPQRGKDWELAKVISSCESVSVHIRRADYVSNPKTRDRYGVCDENYYARCMKILSEKLVAPQLFIFSDDPVWVRENLELPFPTTLVDHNDASRNYEDLRLMSQCKHNIIANSTFSWWGAWLNEHPEKIVIAPRKWFNDEHLSSKDIIPSRWVKV